MRVTGTKTNSEDRHGPNMVAYLLQLLSFLFILKGCVNVITDKSFISISLSLSTLFITYKITKNYFQHASHVVIITLKNALTGFNHMLEFIKDVEVTISVKIIH